MEKIISNIAFKQKVLVKLFVLLVVVLLSCSPEESSGSSNTPQIGVVIDMHKWSMHEFSLKATTAYINPYKDIDVTATFSYFNGLEKTVKGFWDGGNTFKVRFTPTETGTIAYSITSNPADAGLKQNGNINVLAAIPGKNGFLRRDPDNRRRFVYDDGSRYLMIGQTYYEILRNAWANGDWQEAIDNSKANGFNKIRLLLYLWNSDKNPYPKVHPFKRMPPSSFWRYLRKLLVTLNPLKTKTSVNNVFANIDHDYLYIPYFQKFDQIVAYLNSKNIIADLIIMSENHDCYGSLEQDQRYVRYALARYSAYPNIIWTLVNEWEYSKYGPGNEWYWNTMGEIVRNEDPWMKEKNKLRPLSIHQQTYHTFKWSSSTWPVHAIVQDGVWNGHHEAPRFANGDEWGNYSILNNLSLNIPVVNDECGYFGQSYSHGGVTTTIDRSNLRRAMWGIYLAGGHGTLGDSSKVISYNGARTKPWLSGNWHDLAVFNDIKILSDFWTTNEIKYWLMNSMNHLVTNGSRVYVLAKPGFDYVAYGAIGGAFELNLSSGKYYFEWLNPITGDKVYGGKTSGGTDRVFTPPFEGDAVLYITSTSR